MSDGVGAVVGVAEMEAGVGARGLGCWRVRRDHDVVPRVATSRTRRRSRRAAGSGRPLPGPRRARPPALPSRRLGPAAGRGPPASSRARAPGTPVHASMTASTMARSVVREASRPIDLRPVRIAASMRDLPACQRGRRWPPAGRSPSSRKGLSSGDDCHQGSSASVGRRTARRRRASWAARSDLPARAAAGSPRRTIAGCWRPMRSARWSESRAAASSPRSAWSRATLSHAWGRSSSRATHSRSARAAALSPSFASARPRVQR